MQITIFKKKKNKKWSKNKEMKKEKTMRMRRKNIIYKFKI